MLELAEVVGLEEHLTVCSRGHEQLVDLWIAIKRSSVGLQWETQFSSIAQKSNAKLSSVGFFQPLPFLACQMLILLHQSSVSRHVRK